MAISTASRDRDLTATLADRVRAAAATGQPLRIVGGATKDFLGRAAAGEILGVAEHRGILAYEPSELVITARGGTPLAQIEAALAEAGQMLAFEPPMLGATSTIGGVVASGLSGARRPFCGAVRDSLLGVKVLDGNGETLRFGGTVFKNVAGFDAFRLMAGALGCLGVLLEVSLRVSPRPRAEAWRRLDLDWPGALKRLVAWMGSPLPLSGAVHADGRLHVRLSGPAAAVKAAEGDIGGEAEAGEIWPALRRMEVGVLAAPRLWRLSVPMTAGHLDLPGTWLHDWAGAQRWLMTGARAEDIRAAARAAGGHATLFRGAAPGEEVFTPLPPPLLALHQRLKSVFDPAGVLNPGRMYPEL